MEFLQGLPVVQQFWLHTLLLVTDNRHSSVHVSYRYKLILDYTIALGILMYEKIMAIPKQVQEGSYLFCFGLKP